MLKLHITVYDAKPEATLVDSINPYEPARSLPPKLVDSREVQQFIVPPRVNWWSSTTLIVSFLSAIAIYLYHSNGLGAIGDPILDSLAARSAVWIFVYRMGTPSLVLFMSRSQQRIFATFFLLVGIFCCVNDFPVYFVGTPLVVATIGIVPAFAVCVFLPLLRFRLELAWSRDQSRLVRHSMGWLFIMFGIHGAFYLIEQSI